MVFEYLSSNKEKYMISYSWKAGYCKENIIVRSKWLSKLKMKKSLEKATSIKETSERHIKRN